MCCGINAVCVPTIYFLFPEIAWRPREKVDEIFPSSNSIFDTITVAKESPKHDHQELCARGEGLESASQAVKLFILTMWEEQTELHNWICGFCFVSYFIWGLYLEWFNHNTSKVGSYLIRSFKPAAWYVHPYGNVRYVGFDLRLCYKWPKTWKQPWRVQVNDLEALIPGFQGWACI